MCPVPPLQGSSYWWGRGPRAALPLRLAALAQGRWPWGDLFLPSGQADTDAATGSLIRQGTIDASARIRSGPTTRPVCPSSAAAAAAVCSPRRSEASRGYEPRVAQAPVGAAVALADEQCRGWPSSPTTGGTLSSGPVSSSNIHFVPFVSSSCHLPALPAGRQAARQVRVLCWPAKQIGRAHV